MIDSAQNKRKNISFFFPYPYVSGIPVLFSNVANHLLKTTSHQINIIDYKDGALIRNCNLHPNLNFIEFKDFEPCNLDFDTHLVLQAGIPYKIRNELKIGAGVRIIQWVAFEYNLVPYQYQFNAFRKLQEKYFSLYLVFWYLNYKKAKILSKWVQNMIAKGSIAFMSKKMYDVTGKYLQFSKEIPFKHLPLISGGVTDYSEEKIIKKNKSVKNCLHLAWVGRLADFKIYILNYSISLLSTLALRNRINIHLHIIGEGDCAGLLQADCSNEYFKIINVGGLEKDKTDTYVYENIHALFAMGTSSIDGARVGLPVVLLDYSYVPIDGDYVFRYLHNTHDCDLGHPMVNADFMEGNTSLELIVIDLLNNYKSLSEDSLKYFSEHHSTEQTSKKLLDLLENHSYRYSDIPGEIRSLSFPRKIYLWYLKNIKKRYY